MKKNFIVVEFLREKIMGIQRIVLFVAFIILAACGGGGTAPQQGQQDQGQQDQGDSASESPQVVMLSNLVVSNGLDQVFQPSQLSYSSPDVEFLDDCISVIPTAMQVGSTISVNGQVVISGQSQEIRLSPGSNSIQVVVTLNGESSTYTIDIEREPVTTFAQRAYIKASNTDSGDNDIASGQDGFDEFGSSVSLSGNTLAVGARLEDGRATAVNGDEADQDVSTSAAGAVYVFERDAGGSWVQQAYLKASNNDGNDEFGFSVALEGDTLVVGAPSEDSDGVGINPIIGSNSGAGNSGAVYVFTRNGGVWSEQAHIKASNADSDDRFGEGVAISSDTIVVSARMEDSAATGVNGDQGGDDNILSGAQNSGAAYVFVRSGNQWTQQAYLKASNTDALDSFGSTVAISGDTVAVGAHSEDSAARGINGDESNNDAPFSGAVYVFVRNGNQWSQQAYIKASNAEVADLFGGEIPDNSLSTSIALDGDTLVVSAVAEDSNATGINGDKSDNSFSGRDSGAVYVFVRNIDQWAQQAYIKASNTGRFDRFGHSVSLDEDLLVISARVEDSASIGVNGDQSNDDVSDSGAIYIFTRCDGEWLQQAYLKSSNPDQDDWFGHSVAVEDGVVISSANFEDSDARGINGDQNNNLMVGNRAGAVYIFE